MLKADKLQDAPPKPEQEDGEARLHSLCQRWPDEHPTNLAGLIVLWSRADPDGPDKLLRMAEYLRPVLRKLMSAPEGEPPDWLPTRIEVLRFSLIWGLEHPPGGPRWIPPADRLSRTL